MSSNEKIVLALPKGRILKEVMPLVRAAGIEPEAAFDDKHVYHQMRLLAQYQPHGQAALLL